MSRRRTRSSIINTRSRAHGAPQTEGNISSWTPTTESSTPHHSLSTRRSYIERPITPLRPKEASPAKSLQERNTLAQCRLRQSSIRLIHNDNTIQRRHHLPHRPSRLHHLRLTPEPGQRQSPTLRKLLHSPHQRPVTMRRDIEGDHVNVVLFLSERLDGFWASTVHHVRSGVHESD